MNQVLYKLCPICSHNCAVVRDAQGSLWRQDVCEHFDIAGQLVPLLIDVKLAQKPEKLTQEMHKHLMSEFSS